MNSVRPKMRRGHERHMFKRTLTVVVLVLVLISSSQAASYMLTVTASHGSVTATPNKVQYEPGEVVELIPRPATGITATDGYAHCVMNNIIDASGTAFASWSDNRHNYWDYNLWSDDAPTRTNVTTGPHDIKWSAFAFTDIATHDFTVLTSSLVLKAGSQVGPSEGLKAAVTYDLNIGADQGDHVSGGGSDLIGGIN